MRFTFCILIICIIPALNIRAQTGDFYEITRLPFTSERFDDLAPAYYAGGLVFTSNRRENFLISRVTDEGEALYNIFYAGKRESGRWSSPQLLDRALRSNYHDGPVTFTSDGSRIYFTRNIPGTGNEPSKLGLFMADNSGNGWVNIRPFPYNSRNYNVAHPSISHDGKKLYFSSDMPGGSGGMDIYVSVYQGQSWSAPVNLGPDLNSPKDDVFPFIHSGGRLYFSSNNTDNGSLDIFYSINRNNSWQPPVKLPLPFNTDADDFGIIADQYFTSGYFSSNREGSDNLYEFISSFPVFTQCESMREPELCYVFYEETGGEIDTTTLYLEWDMGDGTRIRGLEAEHCFNDIGDYFVRLDVIDLITGEVQYNQASYHFRIEKNEQPWITSADTCYVDQEIRLDASETHLINFEIDEYYWELGDGTKSAGEIIYHTYAHPGVYEVRLGVRSDPDSPFGMQKSCVYKEIVVLGNDSGEGLP